MDAPASLLELESPPREPAAAGTGDMRTLGVALGPSLSHWRVDLQRRLGDDWVLEELISIQAPPRADDIVVLGTAELPSGDLQAGSSSVLVGIGPPRSSTGGEAEGSLALLDRLAAVLRTLAVTSPPEVHSHVVHRDRTRN